MSKLNHDRNKNIFSQTLERENAGSNYFPGGRYDTQGREVKAFLQVRLWRRLMDELLASNVASFGEQDSESRFCTYISYAALHIYQMT